METFSRSARPASASKTAAPAAGPPADLVAQLLLGPAQVEAQLRHQRQVARGHHGRLQRASPPPAPPWVAARVHLRAGTSASCSSSRQCSARWAGSAGRRCCSASASTSCALVQRGQRVRHVQRLLHHGGVRPASRSTVRAQVLAPPLQAHHLPVDSCVLRAAPRARACPRTPGRAGASHHVRDVAPAPRPPARAMSCAKGLPVARKADSSRAARPALQRRPPAPPLRAHPRLLPRHVRAPPPAPRSPRPRRPPSVCAAPPLLLRERVQQRLHGGEAPCGVQRQARASPPAAPSGHLRVARRLRIGAGGGAAAAAGAASAAACPRATACPPPPGAWLDT